MINVVCGKQAQVAMKVALKREIIQEKLDNMRGAVMMGTVITSRLYCSGSHGSLPILANMCTELRACGLCVFVCRSLPDGPAGVGHGQADTRGRGGARGHTGTNPHKTLLSLDKG